MQPVLRCKLRRPTGRRFTYFLMTALGAPETGANLDKYSSGDEDRVYMDVKIGERPPQRMSFTLFSQIVPKTAENFRSLCKGFARPGDGKLLTYKDSHFHLLIKDSMVQGGDVTDIIGTGGDSIYGSWFEDENFKERHSRRGLLSMANTGPDKNLSQFFITLGKTPWLDGKHVVFGEVTGGKEVLDAIEAVETDSFHQPAEELIVVDCGILRPMKKIASEIEKETETETGVETEAKMLQATSNSAIERRLSEAADNDTEGSAADFTKFVESAIIGEEKSQTEMSSSKEESCAVTSSKESALTRSGEPPSMVKDSVGDVPTDAVADIMSAPSTHKAKYLLSQGITYTIFPGKPRRPFVPYSITLGVGWADEWIHAVCNRLGVQPQVVYWEIMLGISFFYHNFLRLSEKVTAGCSRFIPFL